VDGPTQTRIVLYAAFLLLLAWEGWALLFHGRCATISVVLGDLFRRDRLALAIILWFLWHCWEASEP
jgi:hypothetical protein